MTKDEPPDNVVPFPVTTPMNQDDRNLKFGGNGGEPPIGSERIQKIELDLVRLESKFESSFAKQELQFAQLSAKFDIGFAKVDSSFSEVGTKIAQTESNFFKWAVGFVIAIIGTTFAIVRFANERPSQPPQSSVQLAPIVIQVPVPQFTQPQQTKAPVKPRH